MFVNCDKVNWAYEKVETIYLQTHKTEEMITQTFYLISLITLCQVDYIYLTFSNLNYFCYHYVRTLVY